MVTTHAELAVGRIAIPAWQAAVERLAVGSAVGAEEEQLLQWRAAGIVDDSFAVAPDWARAIDAQARAKVALTVVARQDDVAFLTNVFVCPAQDAAVAVTVRATVGSGRRVELVHPQAEVAASQARRLWPLLRRVLPPVAEFRADAPQAPVPAETLEATPAALAAGDAAAASVFVFGADSASGASEEVGWYVSEGGLHRLGPTAGELLRVVPGDLARETADLIRRLLEG